MADPEVFECLSGDELVALYQQAAEVRDMRAAEQSMFGVTVVRGVTDPRFRPLMEQLSTQAVGRSAEITAIDEPPFWKRGFAGPIQKYVILGARKSEEAKGVRTLDGMFFTPSNYLLRGFPTKLQGEIVTADPRSGFLVVDREYAPRHIPLSPTRYWVKVLGEDREPLVAVHFLDTAQTGGAA